MEQEGKIILLSGKDKHKAIRQILQGRALTGWEEPDIARLYRAVLRRERIESTGIGHGVAIAHGKIRGLDSVPVMLGVSKEGIDYHAIDQKPVHLLFLIASSPSLQDRYIETLSRILSKARSLEYRAMLDAFKGVDFPSFYKLVERDFAWLT